MYVYRNLNNGRWQARRRPQASRPREAGEYDAASMALANVTFHVSQKRAAWCRANGQRQVHAFAQGEPIAAADLWQATAGLVRISYSHQREPSTFYRCDTGAAVEWCEYVLFHADGCAYAAGAIR